MKNTSELPPRKVVKIAGLAYLLIIIIGILKVNFIEPAAILAEDAEITSNILLREPLFRIGIASELIMYILVVVLSLALYIILKPIDKNLALSALFLRFAEAILGCVLTILSGLIPLLFLQKESALEPDQMHILVRSFLNLRFSGLNIVLIFIGLGGTVFCYLFYKSWLVPRILAAWGIFTYLTMLILGFLNILLPHQPEIIETVFFSLGGLFEIIFGFWLLLKGVDYGKWRKFAFKTVEPTISN